jgi:hypothetical protein
MLSLSLLSFVLISAFHHILFFYSTTSKNGSLNNSKVLATGTTTFPCRLSSQTQQSCPILKEHTSTRSSQERRTRIRTIGLPLSIKADRWCGPMDRRSRERAGRRTTSDHDFRRISIPWWWILSTQRDSGQTTNRRQHIQNNRQLDWRLSHR